MAINLYIFGTEILCRSSRKAQAEMGRDKRMRGVTSDAL